MIDVHCWIEGMNDAPYRGFGRAVFVVNRDIVAKSCRNFLGQSRGQFFATQNQLRDSRIT